MTGFPVTVKDQLSEKGMEGGVNIPTGNAGHRKLEDLRVPNTTILPITLS